MTTFTEKRAGIIGLIGASVILISIEFVGAQQSKLTGDITKKDWFQKLPQQVRTLADSAVWLANDSKYEESIKILQELLDMPETQKANRLFRAWLYQWMAYDFSPSDNADTTGNADTTRFFVRRSIQADFDIWPDNVDGRLPQEVRGMYQEYRDEILDRFIKKRRNYRIAIGPITRAELGYSYGPFNFAFGIGTTVVITKELGDLIAKNVDYENKFFNDLLIFLRLQWMRKNLKRVTAGFYVEYGTYSEDFFKSRPTRGLSVGPVLAYAYPKGWEIGSSFEVARMNFGSGSITRFSATYSNEVVNLTYGNFEIYIRKWF